MCYNILSNYVDFLFLIYTCDDRTDTYFQVLYLEILRHCNNHSYVYITGVIKCVLTTD